MPILAESEATQSVEIDRQLARLLESHHFARSARYPALLQFLVQQVLSGNASRLKERLVGIEVFHRPADYDTNTDPVVRVTAAEVRKRIAQYYQESEHMDELRIDLPIGSYVPRFLPARALLNVPVGVLPLAELRPAPSSEEQPSSHTPANDALMAPAKVTTIPSGNESGNADASHLSGAPENTHIGTSPLIENHTQPRVAPETVVHGQHPPTLTGWNRKQALLWLMVSLFAGGGLASAGFGVNRWIESTQAQALRQVWGPLTTDQPPLLFVIGDHSLDDKGHSMGIAPVTQGVTESVLTHMNQRSQVPLEDLISLDRIHSFLTRDHKQYRDKGATEATLEDLRSGPVVLYAGFDNRWTVNLSQQLRFRLLSGLDHNVATIVDSKDAYRQWSVDFGEPVDQFVSDYGIVARYFDPLLEQNVLLVAGIGSMGTAAASEFVTQERYSSEVVRGAPAGWKNGNFEVVIHTAVVDGHAGPPRIVASTYW